MFNVKVTFSNSEVEKYILNCSIECIMDLLEADFEVDLDDVRAVDILRISSTQAIRQGKER